MGVILFASTDIGSASTSYHFLKPIVEWLYKGRTQPNIYELNLFLRKTMHVIEFAVLAILIWKARANLPRPLRYGTLGGVTFVISIVALFAMGSELIQLFMKHRGASISDVLLNVSAGFLGLFLLFLWKMLIKPKPSRTSGQIF